MRIPTMYFEEKIGKAEELIDSIMERGGRVDEYDLLALETYGEAIAAEAAKWTREIHRKDEVK